MATPTPNDPTGQRLNRRKTANAIIQRLMKARKKVLAEVKALTYTVVRQQQIVNAGIAVYQYDLSSDEMDNIRLSVQSALQSELDVMPADMPLDWWYRKEIELPSRQGALSTLAEVDAVLQTVTAGSPLAAAPILAPDSFLLSPGYLDAVRTAQVRNYGLIKSLAEDSAKQVYLVISDSIQSGQSISDITAAVRERFDVSESSAKRISSTEVNRAYNDARLNAVETARNASGADLAVLHISSLLPTTRESHAARHGNAYTSQQQLLWWNEGANRINCFVPETRIQGRILAGLKSHYRGVVVNLMTVDGRNLTCTPNHKIMTNRGLVKAAEISESDYLVTYRAEVENSGRVTNLNVNEADSRADDLFTSLFKVGDSSFIRPMSVDFNGDERRIDKDIQTVLLERPLVFGMHTAAFKILDYVKLKHSSPSTVCKRSFFQRLVSVFFASSGFVRSLGIGQPFGLSHFASPVDLGIATATPGKSGFDQSSVNSGPSNANVDSNLHDRIPSGMALDKVSRVNIGAFSGHVYDFQEESGYIIANGVIASNCHCTTRTVVFEDGKVVQSELQKRIKDARNV